VLLPDVNVLVAAHREAVPAPPGTHADVFAFIRALAAHSATVWLNPGRQHLRLLEDLCVAADARGDLVSDAVIAALAVEAGATVVSYDKDFARFPGVRWVVPGE
jgi:predicted nucleic acid-binding protein